MTTNNNDIKKEVLGITLKDSKNNGLSGKNTSLGITPNHTQTNSDDINVANNVSDFLKDDYNLLKNQKKINTSEGNVKEDNIKSGKTKHGDFIVKYLEEGSHYKVKEINVMENVANNVAQRNSQTLTEQWKKGELKTGWYYVKNEFGNIFISEYSKDYDFIGERVISGFFTEVSEIIEIICEVPDYIEWKNYVNGYCEEHEYNLKLSEENQQLKDLLKECREWIEFMEEKSRADENYKGTMYFKNLLTKIEEVLKWKTTNNYT